MGKKLKEAEEQVIHLTWKCSELVKMRDEAFRKQEWADKNATAQLWIQYGQEGRRYARQLRKVKEELETASKLYAVLLEKEKTAEEEH